MIDLRILWSADCAEHSLTGLGFRASGSADCAEHSLTVQETEWHILLGHNYTFGAQKPTKSLLYWCLAPLYYCK